MPSSLASRVRAQGGQAAVEAAGVLVVVALIIGAVATIGIPGMVSAGVSRTVASLFGATGHAPATAPGHPSAPGQGATTNGPGQGGLNPGTSSAAAGTGSTSGGARGNQNPQAGAAPPPPWRWPASAGNHADQLPTNGERPYSPPKQGRGDPVRTRGGGYVDQDGNTWEWAPPGAQHGGPHWDVQHPDGSHTNVAPDGTVIGKDNFPNKRRVPTPPPPPPDKQPGDNSGTAKSVVVGAAGAAGAGAVIWWLGKLASPVCGPAAPLCAIAF